MAKERPEGEKKAEICCDNCGARMIERGCKLVCPRCAYYYSCSDYLYPASD